MPDYDKSSTIDVEGHVITPMRAIQIIESIVRRFDDEQLTRSLIELIAGTSDAHGDQDRYAAARAGMRVAFTYTKAFDLALARFMTDVDAAESRVVGDK